MRSELSAFGTAQDIYGREWEEYRLIFYDEAMMGQNVALRHCPVRGMLRISIRQMATAMPYLKVIEKLNSVGDGGDIPILYRYTNAYGDSVVVYRVLGHEVFDVGEKHNRQLFIHDRDGGCIGYVYLDDLSAVHSALQSAVAKLTTVEDTLLGAFLKYAPSSYNTTNTTK